jgi:tetratricopeptide (TPR) repeat protein
MAAVFRHNESDLLATSLLLARVAALYSEPSQREFGEPGDWLGLGDWAEQLGDLDRAHEVFSLALGALRDTPQRTKIELRLADLSRRLGREDEALGLWRAVAERDPLGGWPAVREIARWHEALAQWGSAYEVLDTAWQRFEQVRGLRTLTGASRLPAAWRQWMSECERLRTALRQASQEEQLTLPI